MNRVSLTMLLFTCSLLAAWPALADGKGVEVYPDKESAGWAYKQSDYAFVASRPGCRVQWNAVEYKSGERALEVRRECAEPFAAQRDLHRAVLREIAKRWPVASFTSLSWGPLCANNDWQWCRPIAQASLTSADYIDYWQHYPNSKLHEVNSLFVELANTTHSYGSLAELLAEFGVSVELRSVEKVFSGRLDKSPFAGELAEKAPPGNPRVLYNAGMSSFALTGK